jgi:formate hydrogenlyase subunit 6/NADH:ubiquinone oxidoreductase subunit I
MAHAKIINAMLILVKTIIFTWHYSYAFPEVELSQAKEFKGKFQME